jgi:hypothetical protein
MLLVDFMLVASGGVLIFRKIFYCYLNTVNGLKNQLNTHWKDLEIKFKPDIYKPEVTNQEGSQGLTSPNRNYSAILAILRITYSAILATL